MWGPGTKLLRLWLEAIAAPGLGPVWKAAEMGGLCSMAPQKAQSSAMTSGGPRLSLSLVNNDHLATLMAHGMGGVLYGAGIRYLLYTAAKPLAMCLAGTSSTSNP